MSTVDLDRQCYVYISVFTYVLCVNVIRTYVLCVHVRGCMCVGVGVIFLFSVLIGVRVSSLNILNTHYDRSDVCDDDPRRHAGSAGVGSQPTTIESWTRGNSNNSMSIYTD